MTAYQFILAWLLGAFTVLAGAAIHDVVQLWREYRAPRLPSMVAVRLLDQRLDIGPAIARSNRRRT